MFRKKQVWALIIPLMIEQVLNALMGAADTMMVSNAGSAAISAVSLVDSINILVLYVFTAMATGGTIVCSQYIGHGDEDMACQAGKQLVLSVTTLSVVVTLLCLVLRRPLLSLIFGSVFCDSSSRADSNSSSARRKSGSSRVSMPKARYIPAAP